MSYFIEVGARVLEQDRGAIIGGACVMALPVLFLFTARAWGF